MLHPTLSAIIAARDPDPNSVTAIARRASLARGHLSTVLHGHALPPLGTVRRILAALEPPATLDEVARAEAAWMAAQRARADLVLTPDDIVSGHGVETPGEAA